MRRDVQRRAARAIGASAGAGIRRSVSDGATMFSRLAAEAAEDENGGSGNAGQRQGQVVQSGAGSGTVARSRMGTLHGLAVVNAGLGEGTSWYSPSAAQRLKGRTSIHRAPIVAPSTRTRHYSHSHSQSHPQHHSRRRTHSRAHDSGYDSQGDYDDRDRDGHRRPRHQSYRNRHHRSDSSSTLARNDFSVVPPIPIPVPTGAIPTTQQFQTYPSPYPYVQSPYSAPPPFGVVPIQVPVSVPGSSPALPPVPSSNVSLPFPSITTGLQQALSSSQNLVAANGYPTPEPQSPLQDAPAHSRSHSHSHHSHSHSGHDNPNAQHTTAPAPAPAPTAIFGYYTVPGYPSQPVYMLTSSQGSPGSQGQTGSGSSGSGRTLASPPTGGMYMLPAFVAPFPHQIQGSPPGLGGPVAAQSVVAPQHQSQVESSRVHHSPGSDTHKRKDSHAQRRRPSVNTRDVVGSARPGYI